VSGGISGTRRKVREKHRGSRVVDAHKRGIELSASGRSTLDAVGEWYPREPLLCGTARMHCDQSDRRSVVGEGAYPAAGASATLVVDEDWRPRLPSGPTGPDDSEHEKKWWQDSEDGAREVDSDDHDESEAHRDSEEQSGDRAEDGMTVLLHAITSFWFWGRRSLRLRPA